MPEKRIGIIGATSFVGKRLRIILENEKYQITAFSRRVGNDSVVLGDEKSTPAERLENWIYLAPIWTMEEHFQFMSQCGIRRLVALSSTSRFTKLTSASPADRSLAARLEAGEENVLSWAGRSGVTVIILQPH